MTDDRKRIAARVVTAREILATERAKLPVLQEAAARAFLIIPSVAAADPALVASLNRISHLEAILAGLSTLDEYAEHAEVVAALAAGPSKVEGAGSAQGSINWHGLVLKRDHLEARYPRLRAAAKVRA
jgi:hypothetical protein